MRVARIVEVFDVGSAADLDARFEDGKAVIVDVRRGSPASDAGLRPGDEVLSIGGKPAKAAAQAPFGEVLPDPTAAQLDYVVHMVVSNFTRVDRTFFDGSADEARAGGSFRLQHLDHPRRHIQIRTRPGQIVAPVTAITVS